MGTPKDQAIEASDTESVAAPGGSGSGVGEFGVKPMRRMQTMFRIR